MNKEKELNSLKKECLKCTKCSIGGKKVDGKITNVFSNMSTKANIMVVGQNPGHVEVEQGQPFVGPSGKFFDTAIEEVLGVDRTYFYITNTVHCYTASNRRPSRIEIDNCRYYLDAEVNVMKPKLIITLGGPSLEQITGRRGITKLHGQIIPSVRYGVPVLPLFHPSPLNTNKPEIKKYFYEDLEKVKEYLNG